MPAATPPLTDRSPTRLACCPWPLLVLAVALGCMPIQARAQGDAIGGSAGAVGEAGSVLFVPAFYGAPTFDLGYETRFPRVLGDDTPWATEALTAGLGYLAYVDGHGRWGLGGALRGAYALSPLLPGRARFTRFDLQLESRWRFHNPVFAHLALSTIAEVGVLVPSETPPGETGAPALRAAFLIASGPGVLFNSSPFLFGEVLTHLGVEAIDRPGGPVFSIVAGVRLRIDYGIRGRDLEPCEYNPVEFGECP